MGVANPLRGQLGFLVNGESHTLAFTTNALCAVEEAFDLASITDLESVIGGKPSLRAVRKLFRLGMIETKPDLTDEEAGRLIDAVGGLEAAMQLLMLAVQQAFPEAADDGAANPPKAPAGTGSGSRKNGARSGKTRNVTGT